MAAEPVLVPAPICEVCWLIDHTNWEPESVDQNGRILMRLVGVDVPEKINTGGVDICAECGSITVSGIYEFKDPAVLLYLEDDKNSLMNEATQYTFSMNDDDDDDDSEEYL